MTKKITFLGVTFKPNTDDMRESSSLLIIPFLNKKEVKITYYDPSGEKKHFVLTPTFSFSSDCKSHCIHNSYYVFTLLTTFHFLPKTSKNIVFIFKNIVVKQEFRDTFVVKTITETANPDDTIDSPSDNYRGC